MKFLLTAVFAFILFSSFAQKQIKLEEVKNHIGDSVTVNGLIKGI